MNLDIQMISILVSIATGIWLGISLDTYQRILAKRKFFRWGHVINDFLFWICQALIYFTILMLTNNGEMRFYLLVAVGLGYSIYRVFFETIYCRMLEYILRWISNLFRLIVRITYILVINPTKGLLKLIYRSSMMILTTLWTIILFFLKWTLKPFLLLIKYVDAKSGHPLLKQRKILYAWWHSLIKRMKQIRSK